MVAWAEYLVDLWHTLRTVGHGTDGLYATGLEDFTHTGNAGCYEDGRIDLALTVGRRAEHDFLTTGNLGRCGQHQHGREEWGSAAGNIETHTLDGDALLPADNTLLRLYLLTDEAL